MAPSRIVGPSGWTGEASLVQASLVAQTSCSLRASAAVCSSQHRGTQQSCCRVDRRASPGASSTPLQERKTCPPSAPCLRERSSSSALAGQYLPWGSCGPRDLCRPGPKAGQRPEEASNSPGASGRGALERLPAPEPLGTGWATPSAHRRPRPPPAPHPPVEEEQDGEERLVDVAAADALVQEVAGVAHDRLQGVLAHDDAQLVRVEVLVQQLLPQLLEGAGRGAAEAVAALLQAAAVGQVEAAAAAVQPHGGRALLQRGGQRHAGPCQGGDAPGTAGGRGELLPGARKRLGWHWRVLAHPCPLPPPAPSSGPPLRQAPGPASPICCPGRRSCHSLAVPTGPWLPRGCRRCPLLTEPPPPSPARRQGSPPLRAASSSVGSSPFLSARPLPSVPAPIGSDPPRPGPAALPRAAPKRSPQAVNRAGSPALPAAGGAGNARRHHHHPLSAQASVPRPRPPDPEDPLAPSRRQVPPQSARGKGRRGASREGLCAAAAESCGEKRRRESLPGMEEEAKGAPSRRPRVRWSTGAGLLLLLRHLLGEGDWPWPPP